MESSESFFDKLITLEAATAIVVYFFLLVVSVAFIVLILGGRSKTKKESAGDTTKEDALIKIIGGFGIFVVAIVSQHIAVFALSLFIGGLIIASEKFLQALAAIWKVPGPNLPQTLDAIGRLEFSSASTEDVVAKEKEEQRIIDMNSPHIVNEVERYNTQHRRWRRTRLVESLMHKTLKNTFGLLYESEVKIGDPSVGVIADGAIKSPDGRYIFSVVEIKYLPDLMSRSSILNSVVQNVMQMTKGITPLKSILFIVVSENLTRAFAQRILIDIRSRYEDFNKRIDIAFFNIINEEELGEVLVPRWEEWLQLVRYRTLHSRVATHLGPLT